MRILVTREFNDLDPIGYLTLRDDVEILSDSEFALAYRVVEKANDGTPTKIQVQSLSLISRPAQKEEAVK